MLIPRRTQLAAAPPLHCFHLWSRMAPGLALLADDQLKIWAQKLLRRLAESYAVKVQAFALEDEQFHLVLQWVPGEAEQWDEAECRRRWLRAHPPQGMTALQVQDMEAGLGAGLQARAPKVPAAAAIRRKLGSLSMFMKQFKQMLAQKINWEHKRHGSIWQGRFHMAPLADASAVAGMMAFVDLRAVAGKGGDRPEAQPFTSLHARVAVYKAKFGLPPYGPLGEPDGDMQPFGAEVAEELRAERLPPAELGHPPQEPPPAPMPQPIPMPEIPPMGGDAPPPMPVPYDMNLPGMADPTVMPMPMTGTGGTPLGPMPGGPGDMTMAADPMGSATSDGAWSAKADPPRFAWLLALREDEPIPGIDAPPDAAPQGLLAWVPLRKYLKLLDALVEQAKSWPHLPLSAPGRAKAPETPDLQGAVGAALAALGLNTGAFAAQWVRVAKLRA